MYDHMLDRIENDINLCFMLIKEEEDRAVNEERLLEDLLPNKLDKKTNTNF
ncbi:hypothetical protein ACQPVP_13025 [Clostridium nigeriense]|uniref:hypothetical protein n=1 Tax=Clostridium nigeriense TaxID=1805470 RepID=UPI003D352E88